MRVLGRGKQSLATASRWLCSLESRKLISGARSRTRLHDFGEPAIEPALSVLLNSLEGDADLHPLGRCLIRLHLQRILETRLLLAQFWKTRGAEIEAEPIERPIFIVGMPRSGSTFLHELLAADPENRAPRVWEVMFPVPDKKGSRADIRRRIRKADRCLWWFRRLAPKADSVYPMRASTPHECVAVHSYTLLSQEFISTCRVSTYEAFLADADLLPAYAWHRRFLQHLQNRSPRKRWVLKSPDHVYGLGQLFNVFPDACIIHTHRNPREVLKSSTELTRVLHGLFGWSHRPEEIAEREIRTLAMATERAIEFRDRHPELADRFIDVRYTDLTANPLSAVKDIYRRLDSPLTEAAANRMLDLAAKRSRYRGSRGAAQARAAAGETQTAEVRFRRYCSRFNVSW